MTRKVEMVLQFAPSQLSRVLSECSAEGLVQFEHELLEKGVKYVFTNLGSSDVYFQLVMEAIVDSERLTFGSSN